METQQGCHLILGVGLGIIASPTASRLHGARLVAILHCKPQPLANLRHDDPRNILDDCHVPLDANRSARSIEVGALSRWCGASQCGAKSNVFNSSLGLHSLRVGWRNLVRVSLIFVIIVSFLFFTVFSLVCVLYFEEFLILD